MIGWRISTLPFSEKCGVVGDLLASQPETTRMLMGKVYHAAMEDNKETFAALAPQLDESALQEVMGWQRFTSCVILGTEVHYKDAEKERPVAISIDGRTPGYDPTTRTWDHDMVLTAGTMDCGWVIVVPGIGKVAVVVDFKKSRYASELNSLQLVTYGYAYSHEHGCDAFVTALWIADEGRLLTGDTYSMAEFDRGMLFERIKKAALNRGPAVTGSHCHGCWARMQCPAYLLPGAIALRDGNQELEAFVRGTLDLPTAQEWLLKVKAADEIIGLVRGQLQAYAIKHGGIPLDDGYRWGEIMSKPKRALNLKRMADAHPEIAKQYEYDVPPRSLGFRRVKVR